MRVVNITNKPNTEAQRIDFMLRPEFADEMQIPLEEQQMAGQPEEEYRLSPEQATQLAEMVEYARQHYNQPLYS
jgi:hypothetical protein